MGEVKDRQKLSWEGMFYSMQRIDLLIVSICGAGIYVCLETIKYLSDKYLCISYFVRISGGLFLLGIIANFLSQIFGRNANKEDYLMCKTEIEAGEVISESERKKIDEHDKKSDFFSKITNQLNYISMVLMFLGLITIMIYFLFIF